MAVNVEGHGRQALGEAGGPDVSRTVGWFTTIHPVVVELNPEAAIGAAVCGMKEQLRGVPQQGLGYGLAGTGSLPERCRGPRLHLTIWGSSIRP